MKVTFARKGTCIHTKTHTHPQAKIYSLTYLSLAMGVQDPVLFQFITFIQSGFSGDEACFNQLVLLKNCVDNCYFLEFENLSLYSNETVGNVK